MFDLAVGGEMIPKLGMCQSAYGTSERLIKQANPIEVQERPLWLTGFSQNLAARTQSALVPAVDLEHPSQHGNGGWAVA